MIRLQSEKGCNRHSVTLVETERYPSSREKKDDILDGCLCRGDKSLKEKGLFRVTVNLRDVGGGVHPTGTRRRRSSYQGSLRLTGFRHVPRIDH